LDFDTTQLAILAVAAFATSTLSGMLGLAGGMTLLAVLLLFYEPLVAIPLHGVIQLVSNGSRAWIQRKHVEGELVGWYSLLLLPMGFAVSIREALAGAGANLIGAFVLAATRGSAAARRASRAAPAQPPLPGARRRGRVPQHDGGRHRSAGRAVLPESRSAPRRWSVRWQQPDARTPAKLSSSVRRASRSPASGSLVLLSVAVVAGTWAGSRALDRVSERGFLGLYKAALTAIALYLVASELPALFPAA
jgi:uncharacterized membrane protein YfcA